MSDKVLLAMSGGIDSSAAAKLLLDAGYDVIGATMLLCSDISGTCIQEADAQAAADLCGALGIEHVTLDAKDLFNQNVISIFCEEYLNGRTPNPCVICNKHIKFGYLHEVRKRMDCDLLATGHYARIQRNADGRYELLRALDASKDQSYFLYNITQEQLTHTIFPLGDMHKEDVKLKVHEWDFECANKQESQDICFIAKDEPYPEFIKRNLSLGEACVSEGECASSTLSAAYEAGSIVDVHGVRLGTHSGLIHYTLGQRKGIGVAAPEPLYVIGKDPATNSLIVGFEEELYVDEVDIDCVNYVSVDDICDGEHVSVKTHYRQSPISGRAYKSGVGLKVVFDEPSKISAPGQSAVIYSGDAVLAGGVVR